MLEGETEMRDTIDMAREVKATAYTNRHYPDRTTYTFGPEQLKAFVDLVRADQRQIDAKVCENEWSNVAERMYGQKCAAAIRASGNT